jgi:hypothetical protein
VAAEDPVTRATRLIHALEKKSLDVVSLGQPHNRAHAADMAKVVSKLSPVMGNLLEFEFATYLNEQGEWPEDTYWCRQDPDFPDLALLLKKDNAERKKYLQGIEVKCWFPFATEMTGRFRESQRRLLKANVNVMVVAWLPEFIVHGKPKILATWSDKAIDIAKCRDAHYHDPPRYLVVEPEDTGARTRNLQQTNCAGYVLQFNDRPDLLKKARKEVAAWPGGERYSISPKYQARIRQLMARYKYRMDTNFSKIDRIDHKPLEKFKKSVLATKLHGKTVAEWAQLVADMDERAFEAMMKLN